MRRLAVILPLLLTAGAARAELTLDPGAIRGVGYSEHVRAVVEPDAAVMAWRSAGPFDQGQLFVAYSAEGRAWQRPTQVSRNYPEWVISDGGVGEFHLARTSDGAFLLAWSAVTSWQAAVSAPGGADAGLGYVARSPDIWLARSADGRDWGPPQPVALAPTPDRSPGIIELPDGRIGVIWVSERILPALSVAFAAPGQPWSPAVELSPGIGPGHQYDLAHTGPLYRADRQGRLTLAWVSDQDGEPQVWTSFSPDGREWSPPVRVSAADAGPKGLLTIEDTPQGYSLYWSRIVGEDEQRWVSRSADFATWSEPSLAPLGK